METNEINIYDLLRDWFDFCFENTDMIAPIHTALYVFCVEHCNRLGWKSKFGLPAQMAMDAIGVKNWKTYKKAFDELVQWKFIKVYQLSKNQYSATVIGLVKNTRATAKALTRATAKASQKHGPKQVRSIVGINRQLIQLIPDISEDFEKLMSDWLDYKTSRNEKYKSDRSIISLYNRLYKFSSGNPELARKIIDQSMANNWAGLFELKTDKTQGYATRHQLPTRATGCSFANPDSR